MSENKQTPPTSGVPRASVRRLKVTAADAGRRLDNYLFTRFKSVPKSHVYRVIRSGQVRVNGGRSPPSRRVAAGDVVRVPPLAVSAPAPCRVDERQVRRFERNLLFEDEHFLMLDKPGGAVVHGGSRHNFGLVDVSRRLRGEGRFPALVHRLDRGTSGCLLLAKSQRALLEAQRVFRLREVEKTYVALVIGTWEQAATRVALPLTVDSRAAQRKVFVDRDAGKAAVTGFEIVERLVGCTLLRVTPRSGRMHQIRVHAAACGRPVAGDDRYGNFAANRAFVRLGLRRLFLHAGGLSLACMGRDYEFESPLPGELVQVLEEVRKTGLHPVPLRGADDV